jgi:hypothetical protein
MQKVAASWESVLLLSEASLALLVPIIALLLEPRHPAYVALTRIIHEPVNVFPNVHVENELRLSCPQRRANQPKRASVRFLRQLRQPWASALRLMNNPG